MERLEEMKLTGEQIEIWLALHSLPRNLKKLISKHKQHKWRGADNFLHNLPKEIRRDTMRHLYLDVLKKGYNSEESNNGCLKHAWGWILQRWYKIFFLMCAIALALDPLFCYSLLINDDKKCLRVDKKLGTIAIVFRSVLDFLYVIHVIAEYRTGFSLTRAFGRGLLKGTWQITKRFFIDILSVLPFPQVVLLIIVVHRRDMGLLKEPMYLILVVILQYVPRVLRINPLFKIVKRTSGILIGSPALNLFLYMLACHVVGAFWYLFAIERKTACWQEACKNHIGCVRLSCDDVLADYTFLTDSCPIKIPDATIFNFGIFLDALDSGIVDSTDVLRKFSYSFWFGLQSLSSLGQNLKTSTYFWEIVFAVIVSIIGLILLVFLIGNMQTYLQFKTVKFEKMRSKRQEIDVWMAFHSLPRNLKKRIRKYQQQKWRETGGFDVENLLHNLPRDIRRDIKLHICMDVLMNVPLLQNKDIQLLVEICDHLKQVFYIEHSCVVREGDLLSKMFFIMQGSLLTYTGNGGRSGFVCTGCLEEGDFYGEELLKWGLSCPSFFKIPTSTRTVQALTKVEAFTLTASDFKNIVSKHWCRLPKELRHSPSFNLEQRDALAAYSIQAAWRRYYRKKLALSAQKKLKSLGITYASVFAANAFIRTHRRQAR